MIPLVPRTGHVQNSQHPLFHCRSHVINPLQIGHASAKMRSEDQQKLGAVNPVSLGVGPAASTVLRRLGLDQADQPALRRETLQEDSCPSTLTACRYSP